MFAQGGCIGCPGGSLQTLFGTFERLLCTTSFGSVHLRILPAGTLQVRASDGSPGSLIDTVLFWFS